MASSPFRAVVKASSDTIQGGMGVSSILLPPIGGGRLSSPPDAIIMAPYLAYTAFSETSFTRVEVQATHLAFAGVGGKKKGQQFF